jgi:hypothetical protein
MSDSPVVRKPLSRYPLPSKLRSLDEPWHESISRRHARVLLFKEGHIATDDPTKDKTNVSPSNILSKL